MKQQINSLDFNLSFQEFREKHSSQKVNMEFYCPPYTHRLPRERPEDFLFLYPNEEDMIETSQNLTKENFGGNKYIGIIGGVFTSFEYISALKSENAIMIDYNPLALDHLAFCLYHATKLIKKTPEENFETLLEQLDKPIDKKEFEKLFGTNSKGETPTLRMYDSTSKAILQKGLIHIYRNSLKESCWLNNPKHLIDIVNEGKIKAFREDYFKGEEKLEQHFNQEKNNVRYLSNAFAPEYSKIKHKEHVKKVNDKNVLTIQANPKITVFYKN